MKIVNQTRGTEIAAHVEMADTPLSRMIGLLKHSCLPAGTAMIITHTRSIHMFFMTFAIDAIFVDRAGRVCGLVRNIKPFRMSPYYWRASYVIEAPPGTIDASRTEKGDEIELMSDPAGF